MFSFVVCKYLKYHVSRGALISFVTVMLFQFLKSYQDQICGEFLPTYTTYNINKGIHRTLTKAAAIV